MSSEILSTRTTLSEISEADNTFRFGLDLVSAARRNLGFLRAVSKSHWLHHKPTLLEAIRRYNELWMPLIADLTVRPGSAPTLILPPIDVELVWFCHALNLVRYREYCGSKFSKLIGKAAIFDEENEEYALMRCREIWVRKYTNEPFENELHSDSGSGSGSGLTDPVVGANEKELFEEVRK